MYYAMCLWKSNCLDIANAVPIQRDINFEEASVQQRMRLLPVALLFCASLWFAHPVHADEVVLGTANTTSTGVGVVFIGVKAEAQEFTIAQPIELTGLSVAIDSDSRSASNVYVFQLTDRIGLGATAADILASFSVTGDQLVEFHPTFAPGEVYPEVSSTFPSLNLGPGEYFLTGAEVDQGSSFGGARWEGQSSVLPNSVGTIGAKFVSDAPNLNNPADSIWAADTNFPGDYHDFQLLGEARDVPEPASWVLALFGLALLIVIVFRSRFLTLPLCKPCNHPNL
jgi:hypothetical protein